MSMFLVPSVTALIGHVAWWPGHADRARPPGGFPDPGPDPDPDADADADET
ncbi:hypothetical protein [Streptodolium elevatio]|uniref:Uncharacterized protein n=1 Tax=Streptodolium elevatio TaxID=3157996 RepID=A0ABV3DG64_9ACTN